MRIYPFFVLVLLLIVSLNFNAQASSIEVDAIYDFKQALDYAAYAKIDTILLITSGGNYTTTDTVHLQITKPVVIMAQPGLAEKPIFTHSDPDSGVLEIFRVHDDVTFEGVIFDGYNAIRPMKYAVRVGHSPDDMIPRVYAREGLNVTFRNCEFRNIYPPDWENTSGGSAFYFLRPESGEPVIKAGNILIENCIFRNLGDEAIRISETEKYNVTRVIDTLIVRNCTFKNISAECIRVYGDTDTETEDAYILLEHLTVDSSAVRVIYVKNSANTIFRNSIISNSIQPKSHRQERSDFAVQVQLPGSYVANIDTFNLSYALEYDKRVGATKGGTIFPETIYGFDPLYEAPTQNNYTLLPDSPAYGIAHDGSALGDLRWATNTPTRLPFVIAIEGKGRVVADPPLIAPNYPQGISVTLMAIPDSGWGFTSWSGDLTSTDNPATITVDAAKKITATFTQGTNVAKSNIIITEYRLEQNYPNPFNPVTVIPFSLKEAGTAKIEVFNVLGQKVMTAVNKNFPNGSHKIYLNADQLPTGMYFYQLTAGTFIARRKLVVMK